MNTLAKMIEGVAKCVLCGATHGACDCWVKCKKCGWHFERGKWCRRCADPNALPEAIATGNFPKDLP